MALTFPPGPLARQPGPANYAIDGPRNRILLTPTEKRVRVVVGDGAGGTETVVDTTRAVLLHETGLLPTYYVPTEDVRSDLTEPSDTTTDSPGTGEGRYRSVRVGDRVLPDLLWTVETPDAALPALAGMTGLALERLDTGPGTPAVDAVLEEEQVLLGHPRDPFHRVDAWPSSRHVEVRWTRPDGEVVTLAESTRPVGVFETALPARWYLPEADVRADLLRPSETTAVCPYKGVATYRSVVDGPEDVAWSYPDPLAEALPAAGHLCFAGDGVTVLVDGEASPR